MFDKSHKWFISKKKTKRQPAKILIIEDNKIDRRILEDILIKKGYATVLAADGETGIKVAMSELPDLILLDFYLPGISGLDVCRELRGDLSTRDIPVLVLTVNESGNNIIELYSEEISGYLRKPITAKQLLTEIESIFQEQGKNL